MREQHYITKQLSCDLTAGEVATYSNELAAATQLQAEIEAEKKEVMSDFTARLNKCIADSRVLARKITNRKEDRQVECDLDFDYTKGVVFVVRTDTGVTIDQRKMTDEERQERLDFEEAEDKAAQAEDAAQPLPEGVEKMETAEAPTEVVTICHATACSFYSLGDANHCNRYEHAYECLEVVGEVARMEDAPELTDAEKDAICHEWRECGLQEKCFTENPDSCLKNEAVKA